MTARSISRLLHVEDNAGDARLLREMLNEQGAYDTALTHVSSLSGAEEHLLDGAVDIILLDLGLNDAQGLDVVRRVRAVAPRVPLVVLTGLDDESVAAQALQEGAQDYLLKDQIDPRALLRALRYAIKRKLMEETLLAEKERAQVTLDCIGDGVACTDLAGCITFLNVVAEKMIGYAYAEAVGRSMSDVVRILDAGSHEPHANVMELDVGHGQIVPLPSSCLLLARTGVEIPIEASVAPIRDREGLATGAVIVFRDVSVARALALQLAHSAQHDFLTGLPNRTLLNDRISQAVNLATRRTKKMAILFLDLDGFKHVNDSLGHGVGDKLLQSVSRRLVACLRGSDTVSRQGGDEFIMLLSEMEAPEDAAIAARRMLDAVALTHAIGEHDLHVTTSIGVSVYPDDGLDAETLVKNADTAMYQAKESGRHGYQFFKPAMNVRAVERQFVEEGLRCARERGELTLHYQPKVNLTTGKISGAEALLRWNHPTRGPISPAQFIPVAEDCGLIQPIGRWVLREACGQAQSWVDDGLALDRVAVNISAMELRAESFLDNLFATLEETKLDPTRLELELTESVLMKHTQSTEATLRTLRDKGVQLAVDHFGTGYSSLSYLRKFSIDSLKIDRSFLRQTTSTPDETTIASAMIGMGRTLKLRVVAEGVETREDLAFLEAHQCDEGQGYYFSRPAPAPAFAALLRTGVSSESASERRARRESSVRAPRA